MEKPPSVEDGKADVYPDPQISVIDARPEDVVALGPTTHTVRGLKLRHIQLIGKPYNQPVVKFYVAYARN